MNYKSLLLFSIFSVHCVFTMHDAFRTLIKFKNAFKIKPRLTEAFSQPTFFEKLPVELLYIIFNNFFPQENDKPKKITLKQELLSILTDLSHYARVNKYFYSIMNSEDFLKTMKHGLKAITSSYVFFGETKDNKNISYQVLPILQNHLKAIAMNLREYRICSHYTVLKSFGSPENNKRSTELAKELIDQGLSPDFYNGYLTFLHTAVINNNHELIEFLITSQNAQTTLFSKNILCKTALEFAFFYGRFQTVMILLKKYKISPTEIHRKLTHFDINFMFFKHKSIIPVIKALVKKGLDPDHIITQNVSPGYLQQPLLSFAIKHRNATLVCFLLRKGANPKLPYKKHPSGGESEPIITPLIFAQRKHRDEIVLLLQKS